MKIVNAFWEQRNLGIQCNEIIVNTDDTVSQLNDLINSIPEPEYLVIKIPVARMDLNLHLSSKGFVFAEGSIHFLLLLKNAFLTPLQQRLNQAITYSEMNENDLLQLFTEIENGLFKTDRIVLDPFFTEKQASIRYINWIKDELASTAQVYKIEYKDEPIGFFTFKECAENSYYPFLAGLYEKFASSGLGFSTLRKPIEEALRREGKFISTYASTNNPYVVRAHLQQGFTINDLHYVFIKHC